MKIYVNQHITKNYFTDENGILIAKTYPGNRIIIAELDNSDAFTISEKSPRFVTANEINANAVILTEKNKVSFFPEKGIEVWD